MLRVFFLFSLFLLVSCQPKSECETQGTNCPAETEDTIDPPAPTPDPLPEDEVSNDALIFDATVKFRNFERDDEEKVHKALEIIKKVVASKEFRNRVLGFTYQGKKAFVDNQGLTNGQIYQMVLNASEELQPSVDHQMDLDLELYTSRDNVVGYTYPNVMRIYMNTKYFNAYTPVEVAGNIFHEWTHKIGFDHAFEYSVKRDSSVPYALGYLMEELGERYLDE